MNRNEVVMCCFRHMYKICFLCLPPSVIQLNSNVFFLSASQCQLSYLRSWEIIRPCHWTKPLISHSSYTPSKDTINYKQIIRASRIKEEMAESSTSPVRPASSNLKLSFWLFIQWLRICNKVLSCHSGLMFDCFEWNSDMQASWLVEEGIPVEVVGPPSSPHHIEHHGGRQAWLA